jgi:hypothetical protein
MTAEDKKTLRLTRLEQEHLIYALRSVWVGPADKDSMLPDDYAERVKAQRSLARKLGIK